MPARRRPTDTVQINLRIKEHERRRLAAAAEANGVSLNGEMAHRLATSLEQRLLLSLHQLQQDMETFMIPMLGNIDKLRQQEALVQAAGKLVDCLQPLLATKVIAGPEGEDIKRAINEIRTATHVIESEWDRRRPGGPSDLERHRRLSGGTAAAED